MTALAHICNRSLSQCIRGEPQYLDSCAIPVASIFLKYTHAMRRNAELQPNSAKAYYHVVMFVNYIFVIPGFTLRLFWRHHGVVGVGAGDQTEGGTRKRFLGSYYGLSATNTKCRDENSRITHVHVSGR